MQKLYKASKMLERNKKRIISVMGESYLWNGDWLMKNKDTSRLWAKEITIEELV